MRNFPFDDGADVRVARSGLVNAGQPLAAAPTTWHPAMSIIS